jgi:Flp pilus assembly protein TadG
MRHRGKRGSAMLEFALSATVLTGLLVGVFQIGYTFYAYNVLEHAVRGGAQYASLKPYDSASTAPGSAFLTAVQNMVVYGDPNPQAGATPVLNGFTTSNVHVTVTGGSADGTLAAPVSMTVSISGYRINSVFSTTTLTGRPSVTFPYTGPYTGIPAPLSRSAAMGDNGQ